MQRLFVCSFVAGLLLAAAPAVSAQFLRDHYAPGVLPAEGLGRSVAVNGKFLIAGRPGYDGSRGDVIVFDTVTGRTLRVLSPPADDRQAGDEFGFAVALRGEEAIVGAPGDTTGVPSGSGSLYFFDLRTGRLRQKVAGPGALARFGHALAAEGPRIVVGAPESANGGVARGAAVLVENLGASAFSVTALVAPEVEDNAKLGHSVAIYGSVAAASAPFMDNPGAADSGAVFVFALKAVPIVALRVTAPTPGANAHFGWAIGLTGDSLVTASQNGGAVHMQSYAGDLKATSSVLGPLSSLAVSGRFIAVGAPGSGSVASGQGFVTVFEARPTGGGGALSVLYQVTPQLGLVRNEHFGTALALHGEILAGGAPGRFIADAAGGGAIGSILTARGLMVPLHYNVVDGGVREAVAWGDNAPNRDGATVRAPLELAPAGNLVGDDSMTVLLGLTGPAASGGRGQMWAGESRALVALRQSGDANVSSGVIRAFSAPVANVPNVFATAVTLTGAGITPGNNAAFLGYNGTTISELFRKGAVIAHGRVVTFQPPRQGDLSGSARYAAVVRLASAPGLPVDATNDTGMRVVLPSGEEAFFVREGEGSVFGPNLGQVGPWVSFEDRHAVFPAALAGSPGGLSLVKLDVNSGARVDVVRDGGVVAGITGASFQTFPSAQIDAFSNGEISFRATVKGAAPAVNASNNEGLWRYQGATNVLILRKGSPPPGPVVLPAVKRFLRHWVLTSSGATRALVQFSGPGVTSANDLALIEVNFNATQAVVLLREGDAAPGCASARIGTLHRVDANRRDGFAVLLSLVSGPGVATAADNLALYARPTAPGLLRQPGLLLRKGTLVERPGSAPVRLTSIAFSKNVNDPTGATASGLPHAVSPLLPSNTRPVTVGVIATWANGTQSGLSVQAP